MKTVGVFFGSRSPEHDISIITGQLIISTLKKMGETAIPVYLGKRGEWYIGPELGTLKTFTTTTFDLLSKNLHKYYLDLEKSNGCMVFKKKGVFGREVVIELAFPAFHGSCGEDGTVQGLFEMFNIPYVGCGVAASAIAMDKVLTKQICIANSVATAEFVFAVRSEWDATRKDVLNRVKKALKWPVIVKPAHLGSSIAIVIAQNDKELENALEVGFHYDDKVLVERAIENLMDLTCCVIGNDMPRPSLLQESAFDKDIFSYDDKYLNDGGAQLGNAKKNLHIPARLDGYTTKTIQDTALETYRAVGCTGIARVDFLYDKTTKKFYVSEINPLPGTLYHHLWKASGVEISELVKTLIDLAVDIHNKKQELNYTFQSDLLKHAGSIKLGLKK